MAAERQIRDYPPGLDIVAERFGVTVVELLEAIAAGRLEVVHPGDEDYEDSDEVILEGIRQGFEDVKAGRVYPIETLWDDLDEG